MATTTTNFGWDIPQSTDLVKDGATAIAALGQDIDTALVDLKGGTTGQVLAKASNTDLDYSWVAQDDSNAIQNAIVDAKGDLIAATANDTPARLAVGTNNAFLKADSSTATGLVWDNSAYTAYTPGTANVTVGNGTLTGAYKQIGKTTFYRIKFVLGSTSAISNDAAFALPFTALSNDASLGSATFVDNSAAGFYIGWYAGGYPRYQSTFGTLTATSPFTWAVNDSLTIWGSYEAA
jgi:hypothetical protein